MTRQGQCKVERSNQTASSNGMHFGGHQSLRLLNCLRSKNTPKQGKFLKFLKLTAKPKVLEILKRSWIKSWNLKSLKEYDPCMESARGERAKGRRGSSTFPSFVRARVLEIPPFALIKQAPAT